MKSLVLFVSLILGAVQFNQVYSPLESLIADLEKPIRQDLCLNGLWEFQQVPLNNFNHGTDPAPALTYNPNGNWDEHKIKIPSPWNVNDYAKWNLNGADWRAYPSYPSEWENGNLRMAWMRRSVTVPADWDANSRFLLHFEAVAGNSEVYVDNQKVVENFDLFLPFEADVTSHVKPGQTFELRVGVRSYWLFDNTSTWGRRIVPAGSMWGSFISGIWQDVYLYRVPLISISDVYIRTQVSSNTIVLQLTVANNGSAQAVTVDGEVHKWIGHNIGSDDILVKPVPSWDLDTDVALNIPGSDQNLAANAVSTITLRVTVPANALALWTPETPNLYGLLLRINIGARLVDIKYERFGYRELTFDGNHQLLNGKVLELRGDSWHFMGIPQMTRRYAVAWFTALKDSNSNAVRFHAQVYPEFYMDVADEMGIMVLDETSNWASDGGPKFDIPVFWEHSADHLRRLIRRDRNHPSVFGWSFENENVAVIKNVFHAADDLMPWQRDGWDQWLQIAKEEDPGRPWASCDGDDDAEGRMPAWVGHYGRTGEFRDWNTRGKPWGQGEGCMAYYGTPEQIADVNFERAYESIAGRMEGLAFESFELIKGMRDNNAAYSSVFNVAWYSLQTLPLGKADVSVLDYSLTNDGIFFTQAYKEGVPGVQPERLGPYTSTFNPGYDPALPLYKTWAMFDAIRDANAPGGPNASSPWANRPTKPTYTHVDPEKKYSKAVFLGPDGAIRDSLNKANIQWSTLASITDDDAAKTIAVLDGRDGNAQYVQQATELTRRGADLWIFNPSQDLIGRAGNILPAAVRLEERKASSFLPANKSWTSNTVNSDYYLTQLLNDELTEFGIAGEFVDQGQVLLSACPTNWRKWNSQPEENKIAAVFRSEVQKKGSDAIIVKNGNTIISTLLPQFTSVSKGQSTLQKIVASAGIPTN